MKISDIETIRGDRDAQKPFVAFGADTTYDAPEPYGDQPKDEEVMTIGVTAKERMLLKELLKAKRGECNTTLKHSNHTRKAYRQARYKRGIIGVLLEKLKEVPTLTDTIPLSEVSG